MSWASIEKIAEEVGVSPHTVHRVLTHGVKDKRPTFIKRGEKIRKLAERFNYRPNTAASAVRTGRFNNIGLILGKDRYRSNINQDLLDGIQDSLEKHNMRFLISRIHEEQVEDPDYVPQAFQELSCDGLIINYHSMMSEQLKRILDRSNIPKVWINIDRKFDTVRPDDLGGGEMLTNELIKKGHKRIAFCDFLWFSHSRNNPLHYSRIHRKSGYESAMDKAGLEQSFFDDKGLEGNSEIYAQIVSLLKTEKRPTAMILDSYSLRLTERVCIELGLRVPEDLTLAIMCSEETYRHLWPAIGGIVPEKEMGSKAVEMLIKKTNKPDKTFSVEKVPFSIAYDF